MADYLKETALPPKKKKQLNMEDLKLSISFGENFKFKEIKQESINDLENIEIISPCWVQLSLVKFVDINIFKQ